ncbi:Carbon monoxide oxidation accessory protein CoxD [Candidatus Syntrophocurvum alkaliphilum]|uniref:Carbon monoxide oxidation accessory protein CoxD n=1 Tax=Candidatus Syntrophocurvum alkaliphilum TaxID=2293317 RepID=A0A6I6D9E0_9FIRM|nr:MoxR family ATPase [Candidatus Syntrophocurvum alkaliphilum]QGT99455.1 Carbon monoxide oxidation accessory protein CoxD [Candidatus Syntrophocurvum alkaliphilum]
MNSKIEALKNDMLEAGYICDTRTATVLFLSEVMQKPILVEGPAGVGKTAIAQAFSKMKNLPLIRMQCYEGIDESKALYEWNYKRQLLHIQAVANRQPGIDEVEEQIFSEDFLLRRPLLESISCDSSPVLLIDEIDKVDFEFEAMLLELLSEFQITIPEMGTIKAKQYPFVFLTSNATRELSEALKRRCLYLYLDFPDREMEENILLLKTPDLSKQLAEHIALVMRRIRGLELKKSPSIAESIDWATTLLWLGKEHLDKDAALQTLNTIVKHQEDMQKVERLIYSKEDLLNRY